ncbi:hypothetical protein GCM10010372_83570 [Streptomyces tauricus]|nr:hypothetical protein GCM10010372_83570 [Streptomyces tauricus]
MDVLTLILLGSAGGLLRGALDLYARFVSWQSDRHTHRQTIAAQTTQGEAPRFQAYFDLPVDIAAAVVHTTMGAGAAVLFGTTGQISGEYAALVVGMSAPVLLTQLIRIQTVNEAVTGERQPAEAQEPPADAHAPPAAAAATPDAAMAAAPPVPAPTEPMPALSTSPAEPIQPPASTVDPPQPAQSGPAFRPPVPVTDARPPEPVPGGLPAGQSQRPADTRSPVPVDPANPAGSGPEGRSATRWQRLGFGEEGL